MLTVFAPRTRPLPRRHAGHGTRCTWQSGFTAFRGAGLTPTALAAQVGKTDLRYHLSQHPRQPPRCIDDLRAMLQAHGGWMPLGGPHQQKPAPAGSVGAGGGAARRTRWAAGTG